MLGTRKLPGRPLILAGVAVVALLGGAGVAMAATSGSPASGTAASPAGGTVATPSPSAPPGLPPPGPAGRFRPWLRRPVRRGARPVRRAQVRRRLPDHRH